MPGPTSTPNFHPSLILHGGAGNIQRSTLPPALYEKYHISLLTYLRSTSSLLSNGATALDAAVHAVSLMEDDELFNCGRGSVFTEAGEIEMEASVMVSSVIEREEGDNGGEGEKKRGAGVMMVRNVRHPIQLAREVLVRTGDDGAEDGGSMHCQLSGEYVESCARSWGLEFQPDSYFWTKRRWDEHLRGLNGEKELVTMSQGTVGCVCLDRYGGLAVATSTGGLTNKKPGRIGDTPTLGAGFWAESWAEDRVVSGLATEENTLSLGGDSGWSVRGAWNMTKTLWGDCLSSTPLSTGSERVSTNATQYSPQIPCHSELPPPYTLTWNPDLAVRQTYRRAVAMSGTGNGDSFLRVAAARTAAAMSRFSSSSEAPFSLSSAVTSVAGPGGELQRSSGSRWGKTGEGEGGIIGIEAELPLPTGKENNACSGDVSGGKLRKGKVVFDFNCGGMYRAWMEDDPDRPGKERERVMVFRDEYV
ncbi:hypothetical protein FQN54_001621 [Arachnomyces sp. PD_36]|nr:hypothetical protein FQN54_001621 [Arachnomyces sp. PD_36]